MTCRNYTCISARSNRQCEENNQEIFYWPVEENHRNESGIFHHWYFSAFRNFVFLLFRYFSLSSILFFFLYLILVVDDDRSKLAKSLKTLFMYNIESSLSCFFLLCVCKFGYVYQNNNVVIMQIHELIVWQSAMPTEYLNSSILHFKKFFCTVYTSETSTADQNAMKYMTVKMRGERSSYMP